MMLNTSSIVPRFKEAFLTTFLIGLSVTTVVAHAATPSQAVDHNGMLVIKQSSAPIPPVMVMRGPQDYNTVAYNAKSPVKIVGLKAKAAPPKKVVPPTYLDDATEAPSRLTPAERYLAKANETVVFGSPLRDIDVKVDNGPAPLPQNGTVIPVQIAMAHSPMLSTAASRRLLWPMRGGEVSSRFGMRWGRLHQGTDIAAPMGTPILAAADGRVVFTGWSGGYGNLVIVEHDNGYKTKYGHCSAILTSVGASVRQGDLIAKVGSTGHSTGPHLHYEVISNAGPTNPEYVTHRR